MRTLPFNTIYDDIHLEDLKAIFIKRLIKSADISKDGAIITVGSEIATRQPDTPCKKLQRISVWKFTSKNNQDYEESTYSGFEKDVQEKVIAKLANYAAGEYKPAFNFETVCHSESLDGFDEAHHQNLTKGLIQLDLNL